MQPQESRPSAFSWMQIGAVLASGMLVGLCAGYFLFGHEAAEPVSTVEQSQLEVAFQESLASRFPDNEARQQEEYDQAVSDLKSDLSEADKIQSRADNTVRRTDINNIHAKLEEFYNETGHYPTSFSATTLRGIDPGAFTDPEGAEIAQTATVNDTVPADPYTANKPSGPQYSYYAYSCDKTVTGGLCQNYTIYGWLANVAGDYASYQKLSLN